ncbi:hypothetical protein EV1_025340 [Malus domestica]
MQATSWQPDRRASLHRGGRGVTRSRRSAYCDQCRVVGESTHPLSLPPLPPNLAVLHLLSHHQNPKN